MRERQTNIELLRILSMVLIIGHHFSVHGGFYFHNAQITGNMLFLQFLSIGGKIGVNLFVLISGYFLVTVRTFSVPKAVRLWLQIFFYSVLIYLAACAAGLTDFSLRDFLKTLVPVSSNQWWFASTYFCLYLLTPVLNRYLTAAGKKRYGILLLVLAALWYLVPVFTWLPGRIRDLMWFLFLYCLSGFLRLYGNGYKGGGWLLAGTVLLLATFCYSVAILHFLASSRPAYETAYLDAHQLLILLTSLCLFLGFLHLPVRSSSAVNMLASLSFGVYLLHDSNYVRYFLWQDLLKCASFSDSAVLIPYALTSIAGVYLICGTLEAVRKRILDKQFALIAQKAERILRCWGFAGK